MKRFDSVHHFAGTSEIAGIVHANIQKAGELAGKVFDESQRDSVYELFFETASLSYDKRMSANRRPSDFS
jgi:hypothetical protein